MVTSKLTVNLPTCKIQAIHFSTTTRYTSSNIQRISRKNQKIPKNESTQSSYLHTYCKTSILKDSTLSTYRMQSSSVFEVRYSRIRKSGLTVLLTCLHTYGATNRNIYGQTMYSRSRGIRSRSKSIDIFAAVCRALLLYV